ncbi:16S rRNA (guanine(527)-N(7))-methyltransferase RsmG [Neptuniibacter caesariensis]|uniref:Ribosomal RNA small subunit methyltransferase G n=1 Tax=Neptuniibacter caesariensis TaxID=207954 RepID=A0A7U8GTQ1_NEPCE|nr:16S rRNA (guanine(527)-N(7))-methyltransferase RsmG [Neptuniibacter caesariensis]EAR62563.1 Glucose inhibited division protein [Oceanospirillum sp. MED92] [Neptuniibacter caesariensis]
MQQVSEQQLEAALKQGISQLGLALSEHQIDQLIRYLNLLIKWNKAYNLTAVRNPMEMIDRHLIDSLSVVPFIEGKRIIDVGSGPGLPGIPLAICYPELPVTTLDSNGKKTRFQLQVKGELGLNNLTVVNERVENCNFEPFDQVISRAFASLEDMINWTQQLCHQEGVFLAMKGLYPEEELSALPDGYELKICHRLNIPGTEGERHLLVLGRR